MRTSLVTAGTVALASMLWFSTPKVSVVAPQAPVPGPSAQLLTVNGEQFLTGLTLDVSTPEGGTHRYRDSDIRNVRGTSFQASVTLNTAGTYSLVVTNPDGGVSEPFALKVQAAPVAPVVDTVTPMRANRQDSAQIVKVDGKRFVDGLVVNLCDPTGETTTITGGDVQRFTPTSFEVSVVFAMSGDYQIGVTNPDGGRSNMLNVNVTRPSAIGKRQSVISSAIGNR